MEHGTSAAYAAHRKDGEKPCEACRQWANAASKASREKRKAEAAERAAVLGIPVAEPKPKRLKSLRDYADFLQASSMDVYTHQVVRADGATFSIHKSEADATARLPLGGPGAYVDAYTPKPSTYWKTGEQHYDH